MLLTRVPPSHSWSSWLLAGAPGRPGRGRRRPAQARPQLLGQHLDDGSGASILSGPAPLLQAAHDHDPAAPAQRLGHMLGLIAPDDHGEERRLLLPAPRHRDPEHGPSDAALGVPDLGVVGEVAGEADAGLGHAAVLLLPGRAVCPALGTGGRWIPWHAERAPGASERANEVGHA